MCIESVSETVVAAMAAHPDPMSPRQLVRTIASEHHIDEAEVQESLRLLLERGRLAVGDKLTLVLTAESDAA